jgi:hypothetical protein
MRTRVRHRRAWLIAVEIFLVAFACSAQQGSIAEPPKDPGSKALRFGDFVGDVNTDLRLPLQVVIPAKYEKVSLPGAPGDYSYWMPPSRVQAVKESGDLPVDTGFFYSKIALAVGYDKARGIFAGFEGQDTATELKKAGIEGFQAERVVLPGGYPAIFWRFQNSATKRVHYSAYIATLSDSITFYFSYTPPDGDSSGGEDTWNRFKLGLTGTR